SFANRNEADPKLVGNGRPKKKSSRVDPDDFVDLLTPTTFQEKIDRCPEKLVIAQDGSDVFEDDSLFWKIRHVANSGAQFVDHFAIHSAMMLAGGRVRSTAPARELFS